MKELGFTGNVFFASFPACEHAGGTSSRGPPPDMQNDPAGTHFDVVIIGSGASGGWAAKRLTEAGLRVAVLEAGRALTDADYKEHVQPYQLPYRGRTKAPLERTQPRQSQSYAVREWNADWYVNDIEEPYLDDSDPGFLWVRPRVVGGRMNIWGRGCLRMSDIDFKAASHDGVGVDWPLTYAEHQAVLRPGRGVRRRLGHEGGAGAVPRRPVPAADGPDLQ